MVDRLPLAHKRFIARSMAEFGTLSIGTFCAGTDCPVSVMHTMAGVLVDKLSQFGDVSGFGIRHKFSSEIHANTRSFISAMCNPDHLFGDIHDLLTDSAMDYHVHTTKGVPVDTSFVLTICNCMFGSGVLQSHNTSEFCPHARCVSLHTPGLFQCRAAITRVYRLALNSRPFAVHISCLRASMCPSPLPRTLSLSFCVSPTLWTHPRTPSVSLPHLPSPMYDSTLQI